MSWQRVNGAWRLLNVSLIGPSNCAALACRFFVEQGQFDMAVVINQQPGSWLISLDRQRGGCIEEHVTVKWPATRAAPVDGKQACTHPRAMY